MNALTMVLTAKDINTGSYCKGLVSDALTMVLTAKDWSLMH